MTPYVRTERNARLTVRLTADAWSAVEAEAVEHGRHPRYVIFDGAMRRLMHVSEAFLLRGETKPDDDAALAAALAATSEDDLARSVLTVGPDRLRAAWRLRHHAPRARIPEGWEIAADGAPLPLSCGLGRIYPPLFSAPVTARTRFPERPPEAAPPWTLRDYVGHLGTHVVETDLGGSGGGAYPATIGDGDVRAILDGIHYLIRTPYDPDYVPILRALPGARWIKPARVWRVKKRWHRLVGEALREISGLEAERAERLGDLARDLGIDLAAYDWVQIAMDGSARLALPPADWRPAELIAELHDLDALGSGIPRRRVPDLRLRAPELDRLIAEARAAHDAHEAVAQATRMAAQEAAATARAAEAEERAAASRAAAERLRWRALVPAGASPGLGDVIQVRGTPRRVIEIGRIFGGEVVQGLFGPETTPLTRYVYTTEA